MINVKQIINVEQMIYTEQITMQDWYIYIYVRKYDIGMWLTDLFSSHSLLACKPSMTPCHDWRDAMIGEMPWLERCHDWRWMYSGMGVEASCNIMVTIAFLVTIWSDVGVYQYWVSVIQWLYNLSGFDDQDINYKLL